LENLHGGCRTDRFILGYLEVMGGLISHLFQALVCGTGIVAFAVNLSIFWIIGNTSPLTYPCHNVLSTQCPHYGGKRMCVNGDVEGFEHDAITTPGLKRGENVCERTGKDREG
jgi:hypothetical protein